MLSSGENTEGCQPPGVSVMPRQSHPHSPTHPTTLLAAPPVPSEPPTLGKGAIRDVEGTHGDTHEDQELKKPKPTREMKGEAEWGHRQNRSGGSPEPPPQGTGPRKNLELRAGGRTKQRDHN